MNVSMYNFEFTDDVRHGGEVKVFDPTSQESRENSGVARMEFLMTSLSNLVEVTFKDDTSNIALQITGKMEKIVIRSISTIITFVIFSSERMWRG